MSKKYHEEHPTISFRCRSIQEYNKIKQMVRISGKSESDFIREILLHEEQKESKSFWEGRKTEVNKFYLRCPECNEYMCFDVSHHLEIRQKIIEIFGTYICAECTKKKQHEEVLH